MNFQCKNCDANMVFDPDRQAMYCPYCDGIDSERKSGDDSMEVCPSCGGALDPGDYKSTVRCEFCGNYIIFDKRVTGKYRPVRILPFMFGKDEAVSKMEKEFKSRFFTPFSFLSEKTLVNMKGHYVPFFLYDMKAEATYAGEVNRVKNTVEGNYDVRETSVYDVKRAFTAEYKGIPADASEEMNDLDMDLQEPFDYSFMKEFNPKYLSGFCSEIYDKSSDELMERAYEKARKSCKEIAVKSITGYSSNINFSQADVKFSHEKSEYVLLPVWHYSYEYKYRIYHFLVNGQNGRIIGETPVSKLKVVIYGLLCAGLWMVLLDLMFGVFGSWIESLFGPWM